MSLEEWKIVSVRQSQATAGIEFEMEGPATVNEHQPHRRWATGTTNFPEDADQRDDWPLTDLWGINRDDT